MVKKTKKTLEEQTKDNQILESKIKDNTENLKEDKFKEQKELTDIITSLEKEKIDLITQVEKLKAELSAIQSAEPKVIEKIIEVEKTTKNQEETLKIPAQKFIPGDTVYYPSKFQKLKFKISKYQGFSNTDGHLYRIVNYLHNIIKELVPEKFLKKG